jgi:DNA-directed RNA polymerase specialized sigma24 family protein
MTDEEALKYRQVALSVANKLGFGEYAEDIAQDVIVSFLSNPTHQTAKQAALDAIRQLTGVSHESCEETKQAAKALFFARALDNKNHPRCYQEHDFDDLGKIVMYAPAELRYYLIQYYAKERTQDDIGEDVGVTGSRINQLLKEAIAALRKRREQFA